MAKTKTTEKKLENPYLAGKYILWKKNRFFQFFQFFRFFQFFLVFAIASEKTEKNVFGRQIYSMEKYSFFSFF